MKHNYLNYLYKSVLLVLLWLPCSQVSASETENTPKLTFAVNAPGTNPFVYYDDASKKYQGVVQDFFASMQHHEAMNVVYVDTSRRRYEQTLLNGQADLFLSSQVWLNNVAAFIFSHALAKHDSHFYAIHPFDTDITPQRFAKATVCTRSSFVYPVLEPYFKTGELRRIDSTNQETMMAMLLKGRCNYVVMGKDDARAEMYKPKYCEHTFYESPNIISSVDMVFVLRPEDKALQQRLNHQLAAFITSGERDASIKRHIGKWLFPKPVCS